jgi:hypothetical protein
MRLNAMHPLDRSSLRLLTATALVLTSRSALAQSSSLDAPSAPPTSSASPAPSDTHESERRAGNESHAVTAATLPEEANAGLAQTNVAAPLPSARTAAANTTTLTLRSGTAIDRDGTLTLTVGPLAITPRAYVETYYAYNINQPSNGITNERGFDNRHNTFQIANAVLDVSASIASSVFLRFAGQVGSTPDSYYLAETARRGTSTVAPSDASAWRFIQQANLGWNAPLGRGLLVEGGLFLSPISVETFDVKSNFNWSRSNLFFALPYYHVGGRLSYAFTDAIRASAGVFNGWNHITDNNSEKSILVSVGYHTDAFVADLIYFGGVERDPGGPEGSPWRNLFNVQITYHPHPRVDLMFDGNGGFERNPLGTAGWAAGAVYARVMPVSFLRLAVRGDYFREFIPNDPHATPIFWNGASWVASGTGTVEFRGFDHVSLRLEYRFDACDPTHPLYFHHDVATDPSGAFVPNAATQQTLTLGATAWF